MADDFVTKISEFGLEGLERRKRIDEFFGRQPKPEARALELEAILRAGSSQASQFGQIAEDRRFREESLAQQESQFERSRVLQESQLERSQAFANQQLETEEDLINKNRKTALFAALGDIGVQAFTTPAKTLSTSAGAGILRFFKII